MPPSPLPFDDALVHLRDWAVSGDQRAFEAFYAGYLARAVEYAIHGARLSEAEREDARQVLILHFVDRGRALKLCAADGPGFWRTALERRLKDVQRKLTRRRRYEEPDHTPIDAPDAPSLVESAVDPAAPDGPEANILAGLAAPKERAVLLANLAKLAKLRRQAVVAYTWDDFAELLSLADLHALAVRSERSVGEIRAILSGSTPHDAATTVRVFSSDAELAKRWDACLDAYRKTRKRAFEALLALLKGGGP